MKFASPKDLVTQIERDVAAARNYFTDHEKA